MIEQSEIKKLIHQFRAAATDHNQKSANTKKDGEVYFHGACYFTLEHVVKRLENLTEEAGREHH